MPSPANDSAPSAEARRSVLAVGVVVLIGVLVPLLVKALIAAHLQLPLSADPVQEAQRRARNTTGLSPVGQRHSPHSGG